jgi:hypothetical protein
MEWKLTITKVGNGYIMSGRQFNDNEVMSKKVIVEPETEQGEIEAMKNLLYEVKEYFACYYSKHNKKNLYLEVK